MSTMISIVDENGGFTLIPELQIPLLDETRAKNIRKIVNPTPIRTVSLFVRNDFVQESLLNIVADGIKGFLPQKVIDERLLKYPIRL